MTEVTFGERGIWEEDIEDWLESEPKLLGEDLLVIQRQANPVDAGNLYPDLVAVDRDGALVIVELKQDWSGPDIYWQASVYAAAYWKRTADEIIDLYAHYLHGSRLRAEEKLKHHTGIDFYKEYQGNEREKAVERLLEHTGSETEEDLRRTLNQRQRLVLVAHLFYESATTAVLWLRGHGLDVSCLTLIPYLGNETTKVCYVAMRELIPGPNQEALLFPLRRVPSENDSDMLDRYDPLIAKFSHSVAAKLEELLWPEVMPDKTNTGPVKVGDSRYFGLWYSHVPWCFDGFSFAIQVRVAEVGSARFRVTVLFQFHEATAEKAGIATELRPLLKKLTTAAFGWQAGELPAGWHEINKSIDVVLDREGAEIVAKLLADLIHDVYSRIEGLLGKDVPFQPVGTVTPWLPFQLLPDGKKPEDLTRTTFDFSDTLDPHDWLVNDSILGEDLLVIQRDHCDGAGLLADILAVDRDGALLAVQVALDGDDSTSWPRRTYWQAPLHAALCWQRTADQIVDLYSEFLGGDRTAAVEKLQEHTNSKSEEGLKERLNKRQRALLVARTFAKEVTTTALWLREHGVDVSCLQLTPYLDEETGGHYVDRTELIQEHAPIDLLAGLRMTERRLEEQTTVLTGLQGHSPYQLTEFSRSVETKLKDRLKFEPELVPSMTDTWGSNLGYCFHFGFWYTQSPWISNLAFGIQMRLAENQGVPFQVTALFQFSEYGAGQAGVSDETIEQLRGLTATFAEKPGWNTRSGLSGWYEAGKTVHVALDEPGAEVAAETLAEVIREMYPRIKGVLDKDAAKRSASGAPE